MNGCGLMSAEIALAIAAYFRGLPWLIPAEFATDRTAARAVATSVEFAVQAREPLPLP